MHGLRHSKDSKLVTKDTIIEQVCGAGQPPLSTELYKDQFSAIWLYA
jgi:hypothetical protein